MKGFAAALPDARVYVYDNKLQVTRGRREMKRLAYLAEPAPADERDAEAEAVADREAARPARGSIRPEN